jgi:transposase
MRFVPVKCEGIQGAAMVFRVRELLIRQRTQVINALRGHLAEFGQIVPQGTANAAKLIAIVEEPDSGLPADAIGTLKVPVAALTHLETEIGRPDAEIARRAKPNEVARRLMTVPGIGPLIATAVAVLAPPPGTFRKARDFAAWLGLVPRQHSTGGKQRLGVTTKMTELAAAGQEADTVMIDATHLKAHRTASSLRGKKGGLRDTSAEAAAG